MTHAAGGSWIDENEVVDGATGVEGLLLKEREIFHGEGFLRVERG